MARAEYFRGYRKTHRQRIERKAFIDGAEAMRKDLLAMFLNIGKGEMSGYTAVEIVKNCKVQPPAPLLRNTFLVKPGEQVSDSEYMDRLIAKEIAEVVPSRQRTPRRYVTLESLRETST